MPEKPEDLCPRLEPPSPQPTQPMASPIYPAAVYRCEDPQQAAALLDRQTQGYVYSRDAHPNADLLGEKLRQLHAGDAATVCGSGMAALALAALALLQQGDHVVVSSRLYGQSQNLLANELGRLGVTHTLVDTCDLAAVAPAFSPQTRLVVAETITNPLVRVTDIRALAEVAHTHGAWLLMDNSFAGPTVCRPLELGADLVVESLTKIINGHSDVMLGLLCGRAELWERVPSTASAWGFFASPFDCWLAARGLGTLALRAEKGCANAQCVAEFLRGKGLPAVHYPGLPSHPDHVVAGGQFDGRFGTIVTMTLPGGTAAATAFIKAARRIPFSPSLGDLSVTLSHPESTSHRKLSAKQREELGIDGGTIRLSMGIESPEAIIAALEEGFAALTS